METEEDLESKGLNRVYEELRYIVLRWFKFKLWHQITTLALSNDTQNQKIWKR